MMNDCQNAEMRDQLPDLLHEYLDVGARAALMAHLDDCGDCRVELELLRVARGMLVRATPRVDMNFVVEALPRATPRTRTLTASRRPMWTDWRVAAAAVFLVVGASSYSLLGRHGGIAVRDSLVAQVPAAVESLPAQPTRAESATTASMPTPRSDAVVADNSPEMAETSGLGGSRLGDLDEKQLKALLTEIDQLQPTPITDPAPVTIRLDTKGTTMPEGL